MTETREALEQQTATAEVLQVINSSPGDLAPVFDAMLEKAMRLCGAAFGSLQTYDGEHFHAVAMRGVPDRFAEFCARAGAVRAGDRCRGLMRGERVRRISPMWRTRTLTGRAIARRALVELGGARTLLSRAAAQGRCAARRDRRLPPGGPAVLRQADRAVAELRGAGGHRDGERAAVDRDARGVGAADRDRRGIAGHQFLARRPRAGVRRDARKGDCGCARPAFGVMLHL